MTDLPTTLKSTAWGLFFVVVLFQFYLSEVNENKTTKTTQVLFENAA